MEGSALSKYNRVSTKKMRRIALSVGNMKYSKAMRILSHLPQKGAYLLRKTLHSAASNLQNKDSSLPESEFLVKEIQVNKGTILKRIRPRARGRADRINKPTSHLRVVVSDGN